MMGEFLSNKECVELKKKKDFFDFEQLL